VERGEFVAVVGPTGCGKSTTLNLVTGLASPSAGEVRVMGGPVNGIDPRIGFVFQTDALFPWRSVIDNVVAGPLYRGTPKDKAYVLTAGPATVKSVYPIDIPRPRVASEIRYEQKFIDISRTIWNDLRDEVLRGASREEARVAEEVAA